MQLAVDGVEKSAGLLLRLLEQGRERGNVLVGLTFLDSDTGDDRDV